MNGQTTRSISQLLHRHGPGSLVYIEEFDVIGKVSRFRADEDTDVNRRRLHRRVVEKMRRWKDNAGVILGADPDLIQETDLAPLRPRQVEWEPYGQWYVCGNPDCAVMHHERDADFGSCRNCGGVLTQLPYVFYHDCGSFAELRPGPSDACPDPSHGLRYIAFVDNHDLRASYWRCRRCNHRRACYYPPCALQACRSRRSDHRNYQISHWRDQWVYYPQTVGYVNLDDSEAQPLVRSDLGKELVQSAVLGQIAAGNGRVSTALNNAGTDCPHCGQPISPTWKRCPHCEQRLPQQAQSASSIPLDVDDGRVTWTVLRDHAESRSLREDVAAGRAFPGMDAAYDVLRNRGVYDVVLVKDFPLTTALLGFTRNRSDNQAWLRVFARNRDDKYVVYTHSTGTEAWMIQLSATSIVAWLRANGLTADDGTLGTGDEGELKRWLIEKIVAQDSNIVGMIEPLLHSFSHVVLYSLAVVCGLEPSSLGELIMTDALAFAIYAGDSELGALSATFEQALNVVAANIEDFSSCKFDPSCSDDDRGSCVGCLHLPRGCDRFNDQLSRAYLFGGPTPSTLLAESHGFLGASSVAS